MTVTALTGVNIIRIGATNSVGHPGTVSFGSTLCDAANEACIIWGQIYWADGGSHTVDTTGSSNFEWKTAAVTWANASSRLVVGLATLDTANGPPTRATNSSNVITPLVSYTASGTDGHVTANAWQSRAPDTGTDTIAHGDLHAFFVQLTVLGAGDLVNVSNQATVVSSTASFPGVTSYTGGSYINPSRSANCIITASDGTKGWFYGSNLATTSTTTQTWNSGSGQVEYGNFMQFDVPVKAYGIYGAPIMSGDCDFVLYSTPTGTPGIMATASLDANTIALSNASSETVMMFAAPQSLSANTLYFIAAKPGGTNVGLTYKTFNAASDANAEFLGVNCYAGSRAAAGSFAAQNSNKDRFSIGLLVGAFGNAASKLVGISGGFIG